MCQTMSLDQLSAGVSSYFANLMNGGGFRLLMRGPTNTRSFRIRRRTLPLAESICRRAKVQKSELRLSLRKTAWNYLDLDS